MIRKIIVVCTLFISIVSFAQVNDVSAYSFFGIGDKNNQTTVEQLSMGGVGVSFHDSFHLNFLNPAAIAFIKSTNYSLALENVNINAKDNINNQKGAFTYLSYLAVGIPLSDKAGFSFGLLPNSSVGYSLITSTKDTDGNVIEASYYNGNGGTNKAFVNFGYKAFKDFSVGLQGNYIFGNIDNSVINQKKDIALATKYQAVSRIKGYAMSVGMIYDKKLSEKVNMHLGANFELESNIKTEGDEYFYSLVYNTVESPRDTISNVKSNGTIKSPIRTNLGVGFGKEGKWYAGGDYSFQNALNIKGDVLSNYTRIAYDNYNKIAIGGFYIPKFNSISSYWQRVTYRAGLKFENTGLTVDALGNGTNYEAIHDFGISFGVGLPMNKHLSNLNLGFEVGKRGKTTSGLVQENYFKFRVSLSLNDKWFKKRQIF
ncbi:hypothetical protein [Lutibacter sp.]|uniref:hypothetical protein n=1 Tax=Lutibacter sp. TaxID=1925666 RepID=UPI0025C5B33C|nr:hypothetical protein [Lutibacter sp.]MCF6181038.1 hypothetical protein [Lutibacter sp.]